MHVRAERRDDHTPVRAINLAAFDTATEADLVDALRAQANPVISLVAEQSGEVVGHPACYPRFGFAPSSRFGIGCQFDVPPEAFMLTELVSEDLRDRTGSLGFHAIFDGLCATAQARSARMMADANTR